MFRSKLYLGNVAVYAAMTAENNEISTVAVTNECGTRCIEGKARSSISAENKSFGFSESAPLL